jgi:hypothetical protein
LARPCLQVDFVTILLFHLFLQTEEAWAPRPAVESQAAACTRPKLRLIINSTQQLPAAEAVIAALYCVPNVFGSLQHAQLVAAVV